MSDLDSLCPEEGALSNNLCRLGRDVLTVAKINLAVCFDEEEKWKKIYSYDLTA